MVNESESLLETALRKAQETVDDAWVFKRLSQPRVTLLIPEQSRRSPAMKWAGIEHP